jgi:hypothetical protein
MTDTAPSGDFLYRVIGELYARLCLAQMEAGALRARLTEAPVEQPESGVVATHSQFLDGAHHFAECVRADIPEGE